MGKTSTCTLIVTYSGQQIQIRTTPKEAKRVREELDDNMSEDWSEESVAVTDADTGAEHRLYSRNLSAVTIHKD